MTPADMTPIVQRMTAAAMLPAAMAAATWARLGAGAARSWQVALSGTPSGEAPRLPRPEGALTPPQEAALDRASEAMEETAEAMEAAAADLLDAPEAETPATAPTTADDALAEPEGEARADGADLRAIDGTLTAVDTVAEMVETAPEDAVDVERVVEAATGHAAKPLDEMIPTTDRPVD